MSTPPLVVFPDVEAAVTGYLRQQLDIGVTVGTEWPEDLAENLPVVAVSRGGGATYARLVLDEPTLDIDVLATDKAAAHDLAQQVRGHIFAAEGTRLGDVLICRVEDSSLIWLPDPTTASPRYVLVMSLRVRPA
ncbi:hypothetical protein OHB04_02315 [Streptomyces sp. NBC_01775]|uniref:hypothetical protein n=1 Tax=Streptomyces sp. NBC_01775 TaxID=2975939 RepID=UPI002DD9AB8A|nr:hypothetical protein [Streptomyces sp. NBC_01775]WSB74727.1 hypothetical protein OHB04_02315 [Streptomyces sp. NBC_01775]